MIQKRKRTSFLDKLMVPVAFLLICGMLFGIMAGSTDPRTSILIAFFGLAYPFFLVANIFMLVYWLFRKKWAFMLLTLIGMVAGWHSLIATFSFWGNEGTSPKEEQNLIRVMTYNVHNFTPYGEKISAPPKEKMLQLVKAQMPDVVCFQEFYTRKNGPFDTIDSLKQMLQMEHYYFQPVAKSTKESFGLAIFSRFPITDTGKIKFKNSIGNMLIYADVSIRGKPVRIYNVHLQSISFEKEDYRYLDQVTKEMDPEMSSSKRILRMLKNAFIKRSEQVEMVKAHMQTCKTPFIITGDFNDTPASYVVTQITDSLNNAFLKKGSGFGKTYNGKFPNFQIDYIATTKDIEVVNYQIIKARLSDHFPVRSDLRLKN